MSPEGEAVGTNSIYVYRLLLRTYYVASSLVPCIGNLETAPQELCSPLIIHGSDHSMGQFGFLFSFFTSKRTLLSTMSFALNFQLLRMVCLFLHPWFWSTLILTHNLLSHPLSTNPYLFSNGQFKCFLLPHVSQDFLHQMKPFSP